MAYFMNNKDGVLIYQTAMKFGDTDTYNNPESPQIQLYN
jgi:hypothetical protein